MDGQPEDGPGPGPGRGESGSGRGRVLPAEPRPVRLMNTIWADRSRLHDDLAAPQDLDAWLRDVGLHAAAPAGPADLVAAVDLRDGLRRLAAVVTHDDRSRAASATTDVTTALERVNRVAVLGARTPRLREQAGTLVREDLAPPRGVDAALGVVARAAVDLLGTPEGGRLRACHAPGCVLYFVQDHPRRQWCSTTCGNRVRAARAYRRHPRTTSPATAAADPERPSR